MHTTLNNGLIKDLYFLLIVYILHSSLQIPLLWK